MRTFFANMPYKPVWLRVLFTLLLFLGGLVISKAVCTYTGSSGIGYAVLTIYGLCIYPLWVPVGAGRRWPFAARAWLTLIGVVLLFYGLSTHNYVCIFLGVCHAVAALCGGHREPRRNQLMGYEE